LSLPLAVKENFSKTKMIKIILYFNQQK